MNKTLNNLALLSFERRARKIGATVINQTNDSYDFETFIKPGGAVILWSLENGFQEKIFNSLITLFDAIIFGDKYENDYVFHFGVYDPEKKTVNVFRVYDQIHSNKKLNVYDLRFHLEGHKEMMFGDGDFSYQP